MKVRYITGNKGGVGKSLISILATDFCIRNNVPYKIVDAEASGIQATTYRVMTKAGIPDDNIRDWAVSTESGFEAFGDYVAENHKSVETVIVDTGASMLEKLTENLELINSMVTDPGLQPAPDFGVIFVCGPTIDTSAAMKKYLDENARFKIKTKCVLISPQIQDVMSFDCMNRADLMDAMKLLGGEQKFIPPLREEYFRGIMQDFVLPHAVLEDTEKGYMYRNKYKLWLSNFIDPVMQSILE